LEKAELEKKLGINLEHPTAIVAYHPVALLADTNAETEELFAALAQLSHQLIFCHPNADAGSRALSGHIQSLLAQRWKWAFLHQLIAHRVLEPASTCGSHGGQFEQRHYGVGFVCPTYRQRGYAAQGRERARMY
jgi:hypothetical protein